MVDYSKTVEVYGIKVGIYSTLSTWRYTCTRGQGHFLTFVQGHSDFKQLLPTECSQIT